MNFQGDNSSWEKMSYTEKNKSLYYKQKRILDMFQERGAISKAQHDKSLHDLRERMGIKA